jgi:hypothetical protein
MKSHCSLAFVSYAFDFTMIIPEDAIREGGNYRGIYPSSTFV